MIIKKCDEPRSIDTDAYCKWFRTLPDYKEWVEDHAECIKAWDKMCDEIEMRDRDGQII